MQKRIEQRIEAAPNEYDSQVQFIISHDIARACAYARKKLIAAFCENDFFYFSRLSWYVFPSAYRSRFDALRIARPLISSAEDINAVADAVLAHLPTAEDQVLLLMGHGTGHIANMIYPALQTAFRLKDARRVFVGTVEGWPELADCLEQLKRSPWRRILLAPLMLVAGDHAQNDMAGNEPDSWRSRLEAAGFSVDCRPEGIGEWDEVCAIYVQHLLDAANK